MPNIHGLRKCCGYLRWGGVRFLLHEQLACELLDHTSLAVMIYKSVMLLGGAVGERMEPVGIVACAAVDGPAFHPVGHTVGQLAG